MMHGRKNVKETYTLQLFAFQSTWSPC